MTARGAIYNPVLQSVLGTNGQVFNLLGLSRATQLTPQQAYGALARLLETGLVVAAGERRTRPGSGRGERLYKLASTASQDSLLVRVRAIVSELVEAIEFTTVDVVQRLGRRPSGWPLYSASAVKLALEVLEMQGLVARVVEYTVQRGRGRRSQRWTAQPGNVAAQRRLADLAAKAE